MFARVVAPALLLSACTGPASLLTGGGPNVAANVQAGAENRQAITVGASEEVKQTITKPQARTIEQSTGATQVRTERVETVVVHNEVPPWIWLLMALAWVLDSPLRWPAQIMAAVRSRKPEAPQKQMPTEIEPERTD